MLPDPQVKCPATGFAKTCHSIVTKCECPKFVHIQFRNPQNGEAVDKYGCADAFMPLLMILHTQAVNQADATMQAFRGEVAEAGETAARERNAALEHIAGNGSMRIAGAIR